jgi:hypothetical protein
MRYRLLAAVLRGVMLSSLFGVVRGVCEVPVCDVRMVPGLHVIAGFVVLRGFAVVLGRMLMVIGGLMMMRSTGVICHGLWFSFSEQNRTWIQTQAYNPPNSVDNQMNSM